MLNIKNILKKYWLFITLSLIIGLLVGVYLINKNQDRGKLNLLMIPQQKVNSYPVKVSLKTNELEKNIKNIDQELNIYEVSAPPFSNKEAINIAKNFNLNEKPKVYNDQRTNNIFYEWLSDEKFLNINLSNRTITFELIRKNLESQNLSLDLNEFETLALNFLKINQLHPSDPINLLIKNKDYLKIGETLYQKVESPIEANGVNIQYQHQINGKNIIGSEISFIFNFKKDLIKLNYQPTFKEIKTLSLYPLKSKDEILIEIENIKTVNYFNIPGYYSTYSELENLTGINLKSIEVVYIKSELRQSYLQPFFLIEGDGILNDGRKAKVGLYLPAIKDKYLLTP